MVSAAAAMTMLAAGCNDDPIGTDNTDPEPVPDWVEVETYAGGELGTTFNVSASAAILLYLLSNRVRNAPVDWRIPETERNEILLRWMKSTVKDSERIMKRGGF